MEEAALDKKGRVVIPRKIREEFGLREGSKVRFIVEKKRIIITKRIDPKEFIKEMEGCIKEGSPVPITNPLELKKIWETQ